LLAQIYQQRKQFVEAAALFDDLRRMEPDNDEYLYMKAVSLGMGGKYQEAIDAYSELEKKVGLNDQIVVAKQQVYLSWKKPEKAFEEINRLIASNPKEPQYYGLLAELYQAQGDKANALKSYNKILEIDPDNGFVHFSLAGYYQEQGDLVRLSTQCKMLIQMITYVETKVQYYLWRLRT